MPRRLLAALIGLGLIAGGSVAALTYTIIDLHSQVITLTQHDQDIDRRLCQAERTDRGIDAAIIHAGRYRITVPPLTRQECP